MSDTHCQRCERENPVWWVDDDIWNGVMGTPDNLRGEGIIICPSCFYRSLEEQLGAQVAAGHECRDHYMRLEEQLEASQKAHRAIIATKGYPVNYVLGLSRAALGEGEPVDDWTHRVSEGLPPDLARILRDPTITIDHDHEIRLADGRTLFEHLEEWRNAPSNTASASLPASRSEP